MDNVEELPSWAATTHVPGSNVPVAAEPPPQKRRPFRWLLFGLLGLLALAAVGAGGYWAAGLGNDDGAVATDDAAATDEAAETEDTATADDGTAGDEGAATDGAETTTDDDAMADDAADDAAADTDDEAAAEAPTDDADDEATTEDDTDDDDADDTAEAPTGEPVDNSDGSIRFAVLQGGQLFLRGRVPSEEYGAAIEEVALGVMGPGNVINEYEVDPETPEVVGGPVYVEDVVLFEFNSVAIAPPFLPILDLGTALMLQNPTVEIVVVSRTDAVGSEDVNLEVSRQRAQAVVNYWQSKGIDPARVTIDARGEEDASDDDDDATAATNRRVEFVINNLFG